MYIVSLSTLLQIFYVSADEIWQVFLLVEDVQNLSVNFFHDAQLFIEGTKYIMYNVHWDTKLASKKDLSFYVHSTCAIVCQTIKFDLQVESNLHNGGSFCYWICLWVNKVAWYIKEMEKIFMFFFQWPLPKKETWSSIQSVSIEEDGQTIRGQLQDECLAYYYLTMYHFILLGIKLLNSHVYSRSYT